MVFLFNVDDCLISSPSKDEIYDLYASLQAYFNIEDYGDLKKILDRARPPPRWINIYKADLPHQKYH